MSDTIALVALFVSLAACVFAYRAQRKSDDVHKLWTNAVHTLESRSSRTVVMDLQDGRITIVKELKDVQ